MMTNQALYQQPNFHISSDVAEQTTLKADYIKQKGFDDKYYKDLIVDYLKRFAVANRNIIRELLWNKLPETLSEMQKENKIKNLLQAMSQRNNTIKNSGTTRKPEWIINENLDKLK